MSGFRPVNPFYHLLHTLISAFILAMLLSYGIGQAYFQFRPALKYIAPNAQWISAGETAYSAVFRHTFHLGFEPQTAYVMVAAREGFELVINGDTVCRSLLFRPTRPFQIGLSEAGQRISPPLQLLSLNYPREYQWEGHHNHLVPTYVDILPYLKTGSNVIAIIAESRVAPASIILDGELRSHADEVLSLRSQTNWKSSFNPRSFAEEWHSPNYDDSLWPDSMHNQKESEWLMTFFDPRIFSIPFAGSWLTTLFRGDQEDIYLEGTLNLAQLGEQTFVRLAANRRYDLFVNGMRVSSSHFRPSDAGLGNWLISSERPIPMREIPEHLDPDEQEELFTGDLFLSARTSSADDGLLPKSELEENSREKDRIRVAGSERPQDRQPVSLAGVHNIDAFDCFEISTLVQPGDNTIKIRLLPPDPVRTFAFPAKAAVDLISLNANTIAAHAHSQNQFSAYAKNASGQEGTHYRVQGFARSNGLGKTATQMKFRGSVYDQIFRLKHWISVAFCSLALIFVPLILMLARHSLIQDVLSRELDEISSRALSQKFCQWTLGLAPGITVLLGGILLQISLAERSEVILFHSGDAWRFLLLLTALVMVWAQLHIHTPETRFSLSRTIKNWPNHPSFKLLLFLILVLGFALRAQDIDFQTIDDDEYASLQASIAIAQTGVPRYSDAVWYTRSPLYHYTAGLLLAIFGENIFVARLYSVLLGVLTGLLIYLTCSRLLNSPWVGVGALLLYTFHPFLIFSAHIARFYQQQQFFTMLTIYFYCKGFVFEQKHLYRLLTLLAFTCAILSQELSVVLGVQMLAIYLIYSAPKPAIEEFRMIGFSLLVIVITIVNFALFQTQTLTRTEGISPNVEAGVALNFSTPLNYFSVFLGYSRLHLPLSLIFAIGLILLLQDKNRRVTALFMHLILGVIFTNLFVTAESLRYQYWLIPVWIILGVYTMRQIQNALALTLYRSRLLLAASRRVIQFNTLVLMSFLIAGYSPWRIPASYETKILGDATAAFQFIAQNRRSGDFLAATEPHPHGMLIETGRVDFDLAFPLLYDFVYLASDGTLRDRNGNAEVIYTTQQLLNLTAQHERIWFAINREKFRSRAKNIRWEYPGARAELFLRKNCQLMYQSYLWSVFLWDRNEGRFVQFRHD